MSWEPCPGAEDVLYILDLHCWVYRFFATTGGRAAFGVLEFVGKILRHHRPRYFAVATDLPFPTFRNDLAPRDAKRGYKANREPPDATLLERLRWSKEMIADVHGIPIFSKKGFEADDVIATLHAQARARNMRVVIVGLDKDLAQLCDDATVLWDGKREFTGPNEVLAKFGVRADQLRDYLAIKGDSADNIPGVKGMGPKAAVELLQAYGSLDMALQEAKVSNGGLFRKRPRFREMLLSNVAEAELSIRLATLVKDVPLKYSIDDCRREA